MSITNFSQAVEQWTQLRKDRKAKLEAYAAQLDEEIEQARQQVEQIGREIITQGGSLNSLTTRGGGPINTKSLDYVRKLIGMEE